MFLILLIKSLVIVYYYILLLLLHYWDKLFFYSLFDFYSSFYNMQVIMVLQLNNNVFKVILNLFIHYLCNNLVVIMLTGNLNCFETACLIFICFCFISILCYFVLFAFVAYLLEPGRGQVDIVTDWK